MTDPTATDRKSRPTCPNCGDALIGKPLGCGKCGWSSADRNIDLDVLVEHVGNAPLSELPAPWKDQLYELIERLRQLEKENADLRAELLDENHPSIWEVVRTSERVQLEAKLAAAEGERKLDVKRILELEQYQDYVERQLDQMKLLEEQVRSLTAERDQYRKQVQNLRYELRDTESRSHTGNGSP